jgi:dTMP kinase
LLFLSINQKELQKIIVYKENGNQGTDCMQKLKHGVLISLEGIDGSGKTTLATTLSDVFASRIESVLLTKEPGATSLGTAIRKIIAQHDALHAYTEYLLFAADRAQHVTEVIRPALARNTLIFSDRFADSSLAYQGYGRGIDAHMIDTINTWCLQGVSPNLVVYVKASPELARTRRATRKITDRFEQEHQTFLERVAHGFETLYAQRKNVIIVDSTLPQNDMVDYCYTRIHTWLSEQNLVQ